jgi:hypothetical protein
MCGKKSYCLACSLIFEDIGFANVCIAVGLRVLGMENGEKKKRRNSL